MVPFRIKTDLWIHHEVPIKDTWEPAKKYFDSSDFNILIVPNSCHTVLHVDHLEMPHLNHTDKMLVNYYVDDEQNFEVYGSWLNITMTKPNSAPGDDFNITYKAFITNNS